MLVGGLVELVELIDVSLVGVGETGGFLGAGVLVGFLSRRPNNDPPDDCVFSSSVVVLF